MAKKFSLDIPHVEELLRLVQKNFDKINDTLHMRREKLDDVILLNMLDGYTYLNKLLIHEINPLDQYELNHLLELNHIVLCGTDPVKRKDYREHITATTDRFYRQEEFSISHIRAWLKKHKKDTDWKKAAGVYVMLISRPQLFFEGNHRTGALLMSHMLVQSGRPPFVLTIDNAKGYFDPSTLAKETKKDVFGKLYKLPKIKKNFALFLEGQANYELLVEK